MRKINYLIIPVILGLFLLIGCEDETDNTDVPVLTTNEITEITQTTAVSGGNISSNGGEEIIACGICWNTSENPTLSDNFTADDLTEDSFNSNLTELAANTTYYVKAYATNKNGTAYGNQVSFTTLEEEQTVTDIDGNVYDVVEIGTQTWMVQNLKVTKYRNGDAIQNISDNNEWMNSTTGAYCNQNNWSENSDTYGRLYNWFVVNDSRNVCPDGWHIPTDTEWNTLIDYLGGEEIAGGKLKEVGTMHWSSPNTGATNETGFTALPAGARDYADGSFVAFGTSGYWWSSTEYSSEEALYQGVYSSTTMIGGDVHFDKNTGFSIRCIKD